ncbi:MAG: hypothetical protein RBS73_00080 [Prolixibacteraceae bacterium]|nr:hypothetical protein [Prolixibacteraceae bacterium]
MRRLRLPQIFIFGQSQKWIDITDGRSGIALLNKTLYGHLYHNGETISLRWFQYKWPRVSSFVFGKDQKYGWATACNPGENLFLGYSWKTEDYPWVNFWRDMENGILRAFGIESGTTGLHGLFPAVA